MTEVFPEGSNYRRFVDGRYIGEQAAHGLDADDEAALAAMEERHDAARAARPLSIAEALRGMHNLKYGAVPSEELLKDDDQEPSRTGWHEIDGEWYPPEYFG